MLKNYYPLLNLKILQSVFMGDKLFERQTKFECLWKNIFCDIVSYKIATKYTHIL